MTIIGNNMMEQEISDFIESIKGKKIRRNDFKLGEWFRPEKYLDSNDNVLGADENGDLVYYHLTKDIFDKDWSFLEDATILCAGVDLSSIASTYTEFNTSYLDNIPKAFLHINLAISLIKEILGEEVDPLILKDKMTIIFAEYIAGKHQKYQVQVIQLANIYEDNI
jgi:hypothetical protein